jgi:2-oxoglutarate ferredoxin oxidoreductase subunit beta
VPVGVFAAVSAPIYEEIVLDQEQRAIADKGVGEIAKLLKSGDTWKIE